MSFMTIYERAPIGALIAWTDGTRCPPKRTSTLHSEWLFHNNRGRLVKTQGERGSGDPGLCPAITILKGDFYTFQIDYPLRFTIVERPPIGSVRVFDRPGHDAELVYLARSRVEAEHWAMVEGDRYPDPVFEEVTADEVAAALVEGRMA
ncbi:MULTISPECIES: hypothetical protein [unclassified Shinella]|uniref:hypothetical protein n=1 Tax=unclassified Shinella TaxID=2643062 RepID=UPI00225D5D1B|nr:hypothetical protein [Shinella sp. YE25]MDC7259511.1 hypothetical protein [Shinella sp. YE25]CAI0341284.1 conserved hypothetical protein [Rhizobiaceae bacterium]CAK7260925.1 conserved protein of unknown function [Shinella sp. WSC3-e]